MAVRVFGGAGDASWTMLTMVIVGGFEMRNEEPGRAGWYVGTRAASRSVHHKGCRLGRVGFSLVQ